MSVALLLFSCVFFTLSVSPSQGESIYLTSLGGLVFRKVRVSGEMTNSNVRATCEKLGMGYPCLHRGGDGCSNSYFHTPECVEFNTTSADCYTFSVIADEVCPGVDKAYDCPALDDVFLYHQSWRSGDGAYGLDLQTTSYAVPGAGKYNLWALCAGVFQCMGGGTPVDQIGNYTCDCPKGTTGDRCETVVDGGSCYKFPLASASHFAAEKACRAEGGHLAVVKDAGTQRFLSNHIPTGNSDSHWIGTKVTSGQLVFSDQPSVFDQVAGMDWAEDSPGMPCALCVLLDNADGHRAKTTSCTEKHSYICQSETAPCEHNVCLHGGNCTSCFGGTATVCACPSGFHGKFCENRAAIQRCSVASCPPGWTCDDQPTHFLCIEPGTRTGSPYQCSSASCPDDMYCKEEGQASFSCRPR